MMKKDMSASVSYFGKVPSRGDFVRAADNHQLLGWLDRWAGQSMELLAQNPDWKRIYDEAPDILYAFIGSRSRTALCGHFQPSCDASKRRFPMLSIVRMETREPLAFIGRSPLAMNKIWVNLARLVERVVRDEDAGDALAELADTQIPINPDPAAYSAIFDDFLEMQTVGSLEALLRTAGYDRIQLRQLLPAFGMLLQPVLTGGNISIDRALELPLPKDALYRPLVASFWLDMLAGFVARADFELLVLIRSDAAPRMIVGFNGADQEAMRAMLDPDAAGDFLIRTHDAGWVDEYLQTDHHLSRFSGYLERPDVTLKTVRQVFGETFLGT